MGIPFLDALLGKLYSRGQELELRGGLNFGPGLLVSPSAVGYDITPDPSVYASATRDTVTTTDATPTQLPNLAIAVPAFTGVRVEARFYGKEQDIAGNNPAELFQVLTGIFRRTIVNNTLTQWGATVTGLSLSEGHSLTWGTPALIISGNSVVPRVTGAAAIIDWTVDIVSRAY